MVIFLQEDHELPLIDGSIRIRAGSRDEPAQKAGLVEVYGEVWRTGGTRSHTGDQMDDFLEARAAKVETAAGGDSTTVGWSCLKEDFDDVFKLVLELLNEPEFRDDKIERNLRDQFLLRLSIRNDRRRRGQRQRHHQHCQALQNLSFHVYLLLLFFRAWSNLIDLQTLRDWYSAKRVPARATTKIV